MSVRVSREQVLNRLREANYTFNRKGKRDELWKKRGTTDYVSLPVNAVYPEPFIRSLFQNAGLTETQINQFLAAATKC